MNNVDTSLTLNGLAPKTSRKRRNVDEKSKSYFLYFKELKNHLERTKYELSTESRRYFEKKYKIPWAALSICKKLGYIDNFQRGSWAFTTRMSTSKIEKVRELVDKVKLGLIELSDIDINDRVGKVHKRNQDYLKLIEKLDSQGDLFKDGKDIDETPFNNLIEMPGNETFEVFGIDIKKEENKNKKFLSINLSTLKIDFWDDLETATHHLRYYFNGHENEEILIVEVKRKLSRVSSIKIEEL